MPANATQSAAPFVPEERTLPVLGSAVQKCRGCNLYRNATQAVFGELETGTKSTKPKVTIMMVGEQPGDHEDKEGRPFVGPAGRLLDMCLEQAEIDRRKVYLCHEHSEALQMGTARQTADSQETKYEGDSCLQAVVRGGARNRST